LLRVEGVVAVANGVRVVEKDKNSRVNEGEDSRHEHATANTPLAQRSGLSAKCGIRKRRSIDPSKQQFKVFDRGRARMDMPIFHGQPPA
jgi:hypothetical protein